MDIVMSTIAAAAPLDGAVLPAAHGQEDLILFAVQLRGATSKGQSGGGMEVDLSSTGVHCI